MPVPSLSFAPPAGSSDSPQSNTAGRPSNVGSPVLGGEPVDSIHGTWVPILVPLSQSESPARIESAFPSCGPRGLDLLPQPPLLGLKRPTGEFRRSSAVPGEHRAMISASPGQC